MLGLTAYVVRYYLLQSWMLERPAFAERLQGYSRKQLQNACTGQELAKKEVRDCPS